MDRLEWVASLAICSARHSNLSYPTLSTRKETTTSESSKMETNMDRELIGGQMAGSMLENGKMIKGMDKEQYILLMNQSMLENGRMARDTAKGLNTLLTDRYPRRECGQTINMLEKDNYNHKYC